MWGKWEEILDVGIKARKKLNVCEQEKGCKWKFCNIFYKQISSWIIDAENRVTEFYNF